MKAFILLTLLIPLMAFGQDVSRYNEFVLGEQADATVTYTVDLGLGAANPAFRFNNLTDEFEWTVDGTTWYQYIDTLDLSSQVTGVLALSNGGTGTSSLTANSIPFINGGVFSEDNANLAWDDATDTLTVNDLHFNGSVISDDSGFGWWQSETGGAGSVGVWAVASDNASATDNTALRVYGRGKAGATTNSEYVSLNWDTARNDYVLETVATGTGTVHPLELKTQGNDDQIKLGTDGSVSFGTTLDGVATLTNGLLGAVADGTNGQLMTMVAGAPAWADAPVSTTLTTKGDLQGFDGTNNVRVPVGTDGQVLTADSAAAAGVSYQDVAATLQDAYDNSADGEFVVDGTRGSVEIRDNATPIGANLFEILSNDGLTEYITAAIDSFVSNVATTINAALDVVGNFSVTGNSTLTGTLDVTGETTVKGHEVVHGGNYASDVRNTIANAGLEDGIFATGTICTSSGSVCAEGTATRTSRIKPFDVKVGTIDTLAVADASYSIGKISVDYDGVPILMGAQVNAPADSSNVTITAYVDSVEQWTQTVPSDGVERDYYFPAVGGSTDWEIVIAADTVDSAIRFDNVYHGLQPIGYIQSINDVDTDWVADTCTASWTTNTTVSCGIKRDGDSLRIKWEISLTGAPDATFLDVNLPSGIAIDVDKLVSISTHNLGAGMIDASTNYNAGLHYIGNTDSLRVTYEFKSTGTDGIASVDHDSPVTFASGDKIVVATTVDLPIQGWGTGRTNVFEQKALSPDKAGFLSLSFFEGEVEGHKVADGSCVKKTAYPDYFRNVGTLYGECTVDTTNDGVNLPNLQQDGGLFLRAATASNVTGTVQGDMFASHTHRFRNHGTSSMFDQTTPGGDPRFYPVDISGAGTMVAGGIENTGGTETRPVNMAVYPLVRMWDRDTVIGKFQDTQIKKVEDKFVTTETKWGKWNGKQLYRRCFEVASDIDGSAGAVTTTLYTWATGLTPVGVIGIDANTFFIDAFVAAAASDAYAQISYNKSTGNIVAQANQYLIPAGTSFCMEYTK